ncbi:transposase [Actinacidiphila sp. ITFR-21]|uniref:transposase n=1 Tax=Actinacidiphila sp. ITFR-21 TaxID=3075199 RepID=UPI0037DA173C
MPRPAVRPQGGGSQRADGEAMFAAILCVLLSGMPWRAPRTFAVSWQNTHRRCTQWSAAGLWERIPADREDPQAPPQTRQWWDTVAWLAEERLNRMGAPAPETAPPPAGAARSSAFRAAAGLNTRSGGRPQGPRNPVPGGSSTPGTRHRSASPVGSRPARPRAYATARRVGRTAPPGRLPGRSAPVSRIPKPWATAGRGSPDGDRRAVPPYRPPARIAPSANRPGHGRGAGPRPRAGARRARHRWEAGSAARPRARSAVSQRPGQSGPGRSADWPKFRLRHRRGKYRDKQPNPERATLVADSRCSDRVFLTRQADPLGWPGLSDRTRTSARHAPRSSVATQDFTARVRLSAPRGRRRMCRATDDTERGRTTPPRRVM